MVFIFLQLLKWFRILFKIITFPLYVFVYLHLRLLKAYYNIFIKSVVTSFSEEKTTHRIKRIDKYFAGFGVLVVMFYILYFFNIFDLIYYYTDIPIYYETYNRVFNLFLQFENVLKKLMLFIVPFTLLEQFFLKDYFKKVDLKPGLWKKHRLRKKAIRKDKIYAGTVSNKTESKTKKLPWNKHIFISDKMRSLHVDITGTTGTGKSQSMIFPWVYQDIKRGKGAVIIDAKGDLDFYRKLYTYHKKYNDKDQEIKLVNLADPDFSNTYNPLFRGNAIELKDRIMDSFHWSEEFYKTRSESTLLTLLQAIEDIEKRITFHDLYLLLTEKKAVRKLRDMVNSDFLKSQLANKIIDDFDSVNKECSGLINNIDLMAHGGIDKIVNNYESDIDLLESYKNNDIVYFTLPTNLIGETARAFGKMLLMDLRSTAGYIEQYADVKKKFYPVFIDEFAEFAIQEFVSWLNKARSSGFAIHMAHQSLGDLEQVNDAFVKQVIDNSNIKMVFRVNDKDTAENFSGQLGTYTTMKETERVSKSLITESEDFVGSLREVEKFICNPNTIKNLEMGQALIFGKHPKSFNCIINTDYLADPRELIELKLSKTDRKRKVNRLEIEKHISFKSNQRSNKEGDEENASKSSEEFAVER